MNKEQRQRLSELIREIRGERSLRELARELEVSAVSVNSWEKGDSVPGIESLDAIAQGAKKLLAFPNKPCPNDCTPKKPFCGHGNGTWGTVAYAKKKGLEIELHPLTATAKTPDWLKQLSLF
jgi:transcriptional regulator with XRE-family HTH domain